jgi:hypothetical protein
MKTRIGDFGLFRYSSLSQSQVNDWLTLEELCLIACGGVWIGIYSAFDIIRWARSNGLIRLSEYEFWFNRLQDA